MKSTLALLALTATAASAFQAAPASSRQSTALNNFLDGRGKKITVRDDEDAAMWFDDGAGGRTPSEKPKKPDPKKPVKKEAKGGFKFPWDN